MGRASNRQGSYTARSYGSYTARSYGRPGLPAGARLWTPRRASFSFADILPGPDTLSAFDRHPCIVALSLIVVLSEGPTVGGFVMYVGTLKHLQLHKLQHTHHIDI